MEFQKPIDELNCGSQKMCVYLGDSGCSTVLIVREEYSNTHHFKCLYYTNRAIQSLILENVHWDAIHCSLHVVLHVSCDNDCFLDQHRCTKVAKVGTSLSGLLSYL